MSVPAPGRTRVSGAVTEAVGAAPLRRAVSREADRQGLGLARIDVGHLNFSAEDDIVDEITEKDSAG